MAEPVNHARSSAASTLDSFCSHALKYTVPFFGFQDDKMKQQGSGVLFRIADSHFVLTACHVLRPAAKHGIPIFIGAGVGDTAGLPVRGLTIRVHDDPLDIAVIELPPEMAKQVSESNRFANLAQCDFSPSFGTDEPFLLFGFPQVDSRTDSVKKVISVKPFGYITSLYHIDDRTFPDDVYKEGCHLLFDFPKDHGADAEGNLIPLPPPHGISGCGAWRIARPSFTNEKWNPDDLRLVAIEHSLLPETRALVATRLIYALDIIRKSHPELDMSIAVSLRGLK